MTRGNFISYYAMKDSRLLYTAAAREFETSRGGGLEGTPVCDERHDCPGTTDFRVNFVFKMMDFVLKGFVVNMMAS